MAPRKHEAVHETISVLGFVSDNSVEDDAPALPGCVEFQASGTRTPSPPGTVVASSRDAADSPLVTASSLPLSGVNAVPGGLENLLIGLSSPSFYTSLASPHKLGPDIHGAVASTSAVKTAAATAAFELSMTCSATLGVQLCSACGRQGAQNIHTDGGLNAGGSNGTRAMYCPAAAAEAACVRCPCWQPSGYLMCGIADRDVTARPMVSLSTKRGLYEGSVRGGNVRNTWYVTTTRNPPG
ncbi:hypothetical protein Vretimale_12738 [Volvox reticuliferus]|uniref:Uncharacterized protein n=1 Tax=Volvox reticuliferus TaxID=1737510 RepID=A0A8J4CE32_9CHLO|nr:hypothetical protein Vretifemale_10054 [Volvox reticuliferus]GIM08789.1 hypothetical protein Vretimale_12738 [Volvox reticuliferus]